MLELLVATSRRALRLRWARASTAGPTPVVAAAGIEPATELAAAARVALIDNDEQLGLLECGPKRGGPLNAHDRQLLGALGREAALRLRTVSQADELEAACARSSARPSRSPPRGRASSRPRTPSGGASSGTSTTACSRTWPR